MSKKKKKEKKKKGVALCYVGAGLQLHALEANGRARCENHYPGGNYQDKDRTADSVITPVGRVGTPTCHWCRRASR